MSTVRKRKNMLAKLNLFFRKQGKVLTEREYMAASGVPYRITMIDKYLGGWPRMVRYLEFYYPQWKAEEEKIEVVEILVEEAEEKVSPREALYKKALEPEDDE